MGAYGPTVVLGGVRLLESEVRLYLYTAVWGGGQVSTGRDAVVAIH